MLLGEMGSGHVWICVVVRLVVNEHENKEVCLVSHLFSTNLIEIRKQVVILDYTQHRPEIWLAFILDV